MKPQSLKVIISGGGTGGHIFPALAIADELRQQRPGVQILFVGAKGRMEMDRVPKAGYPIKGLWISGFQRKMSWSNLLFPLKLVCSMAKANTVLRQFKPDVVIGVGGYASGPTLRMAIRRKIPTLIQEQNSYPGITNRLLAKEVNKICVAYEDMEKWFAKEKTLLTGNPLRIKAVETQGKKEVALKYFQLNDCCTVAFVTGGSQGALAINNAIKNNIEKIHHADIQLIWQTGKPFFGEARQAVHDAGLSEKIKVVDFVERMDLAYAASDLVVSRAGAMAISELSFVGKAVILVPLPTAAEDHQTQNALRLVNKGAAILIQNSEADKELLPAIIGLASKKQQREEMSACIQQFALPDAGKNIVAQILNLAER